MRYRFLVLVTAVWVSLTAPSLAQAQSNSLKPALERLSEGAFVKLQLHDEHERPVGRLTSWDETFLVLAEDHRRARFRADAVERLWSASGHRGGKGALIGGLVGAGTFAGLAAVILTPGEGQGPPFISPGRGAALAALPGVLVGGFFGYFIGRESKRWHLRFSAPEGTLGLQVRFPPNRR